MCHSKELCMVDLNIQHTVVERDPRYSNKCFENQYYFMKVLKQNN